RDRHDVVALGEHPRKRQLRGRRALFRRELFDFRDELEVLREVLALETGRLAAKIVRSEIFEALDFARQKAATERTVGDESDAELPAGRERSILRIPGPEGIFGLERRDGMHGARAAHRLGPGFGKTEEAHLALFDE